MRGMPKYLNTKKDYLNLKKDFPGTWHPAFQNLLDNRFCWVNTGTAVGDGITDGTHKVVSSETTPGVIVNYQLELQEDPNAKLFRLGFAIEEIEDLLEN
jgi:hypothetical protein